MKHLLVVAAVPVLPVVWLLAQTASNEAPPPSLPFANMGQVWLAVIMLAGSVFTHVMNSRREERQRKWLIEDRKAAQIEAEKTAVRVRADLLQEAEAIKQEAWKRTDLITNSIAENTRISADAVKAANDVNQKIAAVGGMRRVQDANRRLDDPLPDKS